MKMLENLQDDFDFNYKTLKSAGGKNQTVHALGLVSLGHGAKGFHYVLLRAHVCNHKSVDVTSFQSCPRT